MIRWFRNFIVSRMIRSIARDLDTNQDGKVEVAEVNALVNKAIAPMVEAVCETVNAKSRK